MTKTIVYLGKAQEVRNGILYLTHYVSYEGEYGTRYSTTMSEEAWGNFIEVTKATMI